MAPVGDNAVVEQMSVDVAPVGNNAVVDRMDVDVDLDDGDNASSLLPNAALAALRAFDELPSPTAAAADDPPARRSSRVRKPNVRHVPLEDLPPTPFASC